MKLKPLFSTEQLLRNEVTPELARAVKHSQTLRRNFGVKPNNPPADGQAQTTTRKCLI